MRRRQIGRRFRTKLDGLAADLHDVLDGQEQLVRLGQVAGLARDPTGLARGSVGVVDRVTDAAPTVRHIGPVVDGRARNGLEDGLQPARQVLCDGLAGGIRLEQRGRGGKAVGIDAELGHRAQLQPRALRGTALGERVDAGDELDAIILQIQADRFGLAGGEDVDDLPAQGSLAGLVDRLVPMVVPDRQGRAERVPIDAVAAMDRQFGRPPHLGGTHPLERGGGAGEQQAGERGGLGETGERRDPAADGARRGRHQIIRQHVDRW